MKAIILTIATLSIISTGCKTSEKHNLHHFDAAYLDEHSSKNSLDWEGTYTGTIPCADCRGIDTKISINKDLTYTKQVKYLGKHEDYITTKGNFVWDEIGSNIIIDDVSYMVGENTLIQLNQQKENIKGALATQYVLGKTATDTLLTNLKWELFELRGQEIERENKNIPFFTLDISNNSIAGSSGCNNFHGNFELKTGNKVSFSKIVATQKLCFNAPYEGPLLNALETIDNYTIKNDTLTLNKARMASLAKFVAVK
ncbi:copper resistance protein NlpE N-terminal domain-containing protein [Wenyingzhuangia sp. IMCC45467]